MVSNLTGRFIAFVLGFASIFLSANLCLFDLRAGGVLFSVLEVLHGRTLSFLCLIGLRDFPVLLQPSRPWHWAFSGGTARCMAYDYKIYHRLVSGHFRLGRSFGYVERSFGAVPAGLAHALAMEGSSSLYRLS